jgi:hypothetical protein
MAESASHSFGQFLGNLLEALILPELSSFCSKHDLYLDKHGVRPGVRRGKKATWIDDFGNNHDLDFVIEKNGTFQNQGRPLAFIEVAWRRYTKHSKNKAQEIQGAILPLSEKYKHDKPLLGAILAGCFTLPSLEQLRSLGFDVVYIDYDQMVEACSAAGLDISFDEETTEASFSARLSQIARGGPDLQ